MLDSYYDRIHQLSKLESDRLPPHWSLYVAGTYGGETIENAVESHWRIKNLPYT